ncbi:MAG: hypothetical protein U0744_09895 [Gemmataceae bacterium]
MRAFLFGSTVGRRIMTFDPKPDAPAESAARFKPIVADFKDAFLRTHDGSLPP